MNKNEVKRIVRYCPTKFSKIQTIINIQILRNKRNDILVTKRGI